MAVELLQYKIELDDSQARNSAAMVENDLRMQQQVAKQVGDEFDAATKRLDAGFKAAEKSVASFEKAQAQAQRSAQTEAEKTTSVLTKLAGVIGTGAFIAAIKSAADYADRLGELSQQTGMGVVALQKFDAAARLNGSNLEAVATSAGLFQDRLAGGDKSVIGAVAKLGLSLDSLRQLSPDEQMRALAEAVTGIADPTERANVATDLFGRSGRALIPTLAEIAGQYDKLPAMSADVVNATGNLADEWDALTHTGQVMIVQALAPLVTAFGDNKTAILNLTTVMPSLQQGFETYVVLASIKAAKALIDFGITLGDLEGYIPGLSTVLGTTSAGMEKMRSDSQYLSDVIKGMQQPTLEATTASQKHGLALVDTASAAKSLSERLADSRTAIANLTDDQKAQIVAGKTMGDSVKDITDSLNKQYPALHLTQDAVKLYESQLKTAATQAKENAKFHGDLVVALEETQTALGNLKAKQIAEIESGLAMHTNLKDIAHAADTTVDVVRLYESSLKSATDSQRAYNAEVKATEEFQHRMDMSLKASYDQMHELLAKEVKEATEGATRFDETIKGEFDAMVEANKAADDNIRQVTLSSLDYQIDHIKRSADAKKQMYADDTALAAMAREAIDREADTAIAALKRQHDPLLNLFKDIREQLVNLGKTVNDNFAQMLTGAESFGDGFKNIWHALRDTATSILADILTYLEKVFIVRMIASFAGGSGVIGSLLATAISGGVQAGVANAAVSSATQAGVGAGVQTATGVGTTGAGLAASHAGLGATAAVVAAPAAGALVGGVVGWKVGRATGNWELATAAGAGSGAATGALVGSVVPGAGTAIGAGVGAAVGAIAGAVAAHKANEDARNQMVAIRAELEKTFGSLDNVRKQAQFVGVDIDKAFANIGRGVSGTKEFNKVIDEFQTKWNDLDGAMKRYGITLSDLQDAQKNPQQLFADQSKQLESDFKALTGVGGNLPKDTVITKMADSFNALLIAAKDSGSKIPADLEPILDRMVELGLVSDDAKNKLLGLGTASSGDLQKATDIANKYGISLAQLGPSFEQAQISARAKDIYADFSTLKDLNVDIGGSLAGMSDEISQFVQDAIKAGAEVPENMRPILDELVKNGQLLDENGQAMTDLTKIKFGAPIADQFKPVTDAIHELIDVLSGRKPGTDSLPGAFEDGIGKLEGIAKGTDIRVPIHYQYDTIDVPTPPGAAHGGLVTDTGVQYLASGGVTMGRLLGFRPRGTDTVPAMLTPGEGVINRRGMAALSQMNNGHVGGDVFHFEKGSIQVNGADDPEAVAEAIMRKMRDRRKYGRRIA